MSNLLHYKVWITYHMKLNCSIDQGYGVMDSSIFEADEYVVYYDGRDTMVSVCSLFSLN